MTNVKKRDRRGTFLREPQHTKYQYESYKTFLSALTFFCPFSQARMHHTLALRCEDALLAFASWQWLSKTSEAKAGNETGGWLSCAVCIGHFGLFITITENFKFFVLHLEFKKPGIVDVYWLLCTTKTNKHNR